MSKSLVLVESPAKAKTIEKYLGKDFKVLATYGHIKDLPEKYLGVRIEKGFEPIYELTGKAKKVVNEIKKSAQLAEKIFIASDPDREGEAIAFHVKEELEDLKKDIKRVIFFEITKNAISKAFESPAELDIKKYNAQKSRRVLDRIVGYKISPLLWYKVKAGLSAGRVQSVALLLICEREKEIKSFVPEEYWTIKGDFKSPDEKLLRAKLEEIDSKKVNLKNKEEVEGVLKALKKSAFYIKSVIEKERIKKAGEPFITSTLQQDAVKRLRFSTKKTMMIAQMLYEGVDLGRLGRQGLITYMRTDSPRISEEAISMARSYIEKKFGKDYLSTKPRQFEGKKQAQEAHECIRPTNLELEPDLIKEFLAREQYLLYRMIFNRFIASQMKDAVYSQRIYEIVDKDEENFMFRAKGLSLKFSGFLSVYGKEGEDESEEDKEGTLPLLEKGTELSLEEILPEQNFTAPPPRYTEATLVKELEEDGIGRPSTYASIISTLLEKHYAKLEEGKFYPTELGCIVAEQLAKNFPEIINVEFTARMEEKLDLIEEGKEDWVSVMKEFYSRFEETLKKAKTTMEDLKKKGIETDILCDLCGRKMVIKSKNKSEFLACSGYPECKNIKNFTKDKLGKIVLIDNKTDKKCPLCGGDLLMKKGPYSSFLACSNYPNCKHTENITTGIRCPKCQSGELVERRTKKGRIFYGCNRYPNCDFLITQKPVKEECPDCGYPFLLEKKEKNRAVLYCPNKDCHFKKEK